MKEVNINTENWDIQPKVSFNERVSFRIARWILIVFTSVCILTCILILFAFQRQDATFQGIVELIKFPLTIILPIVTLAVGYYLGDKQNGNAN